MLYLFITLFSLVNDTIENKTLKLDEFISIVELKHPQIRQAALIEEQSNAYDLKARAGFDPVLSSDWDLKSFDDKQYYNRLNAMLKMPTKIGVDLKVSYENNSGQYLNNMDVLADNGLLSIGFGVPLGQGLFFDERRKILKESSLITEANKLKRQKVLNKLHFEAAKAYLVWQEAYFKLENQKYAVELAKLRYENIVSLSMNGDKPAIDTLESYVVLKNREESLLDYQQKSNQARQLLNNYLWQEDKLTFLMDTLIIPESIDESKWLNNIGRLIENQDRVLEDHLLVNELENRRGRRQLDRRMAKEQLKPVFNLNYNPIFRFDNGHPVWGYDFQNYKLGVEFYYPLFARKAKAEIELIDIYLEMNHNEGQLLKEALDNNITYLVAKEDFLNEQLLILKNNSTNYNNLLEAEKIKYEIGESSIFLLNNREIKLIENNNKILSKQKELLKNRLELLFVSQLGI